MNGSFYCVITDVWCMLPEGWIDMESVGVGVCAVGGARVQAQRVPQSHMLRAD